MLSALISHISHISVLLPRLTNNNRHSVTKLKIKYQSRQNPLNLRYRFHATGDHGDDRIH